MISYIKEPQVFPGPERTSMEGRFYGACTVVDPSEPDGRKTYYLRSDGQWLGSVQDENGGNSGYFADKAVAQARLNGSLHKLERMLIAKDDRDQQMPGMGY